MAAVDRDKFQWRQPTQQQPQLIGLDDPNFLYIPKDIHSGVKGVYMSIRDMICTLHIDIEDIPELTNIAQTEGDIDGSFNLYFQTEQGKPPNDEIIAKIKRYINYFNTKNNETATAYLMTITQKMLSNKYLKYKEKYLKLKSKMI